VKEDSSSRLEATVNAVIRPTVSVELERGTPSVAVKIEGEERVMIIGTGSNTSILQPGISTSVIRHTDMRPYGVTGETLDVRDARPSPLYSVGVSSTTSFWYVLSPPKRKAY
jgi:UDP-N-acetylenolpyruvoylglucosamine reductase